MDGIKLMEQLEASITSGAKVPVTGKVLVDLDKTLEILRNVKSLLPKDVAEAEEILSQRESIINQAYMEAQRIKASADEEAKAKLDDNEVIREARVKAEEVLANTRRECEELVRGAEKSGDKTKLEAEKFAESRKAESDDYAQDVLYNLEQELSNTLATVRRGLDVLSNSHVDEGAKVG
jgi:vacuolar-type H+-ATPase subunit H